MCDILAVLIIKDIKESGYDPGINLITAMILSDKTHDIDLIPLETKRALDDVLILERATANEELPAIGIHRGEQFLRIWAKSDHNLNVGDTIRF